MFITMITWRTAQARTTCALLSASGARDGGDIVLYEILNLVDGKRSIPGDTRLFAAAYGPIPVEDVADYLRLLEKIGVVKL